jgi:hypothetical protein
MRVSFGETFEHFLRFFFQLPEFLQQLVRRGGNLPRSRSADFQISPARLSSLSLLRERAMKLEFSGASSWNDGKTVCGASARESSDDGLAWEERKGRGHTENPVRRYFPSNGWDEEAHAVSVGVTSAFPIGYVMSKFERQCLFPQSKSCRRGRDI